MMTTDSPTVQGGNARGRAETWRSARPDRLWTAEYFSKGTDRSIHTAEELRAVEERLNNRPRKILDWCTPAEVFTRALAP